MLQLFPPGGERHLRLPGEGGGGRGVFERGAELGWGNDFI